MRWLAGRLRGPAAIRLGTKALGASAAWFMALFFVAMQALNVDLELIGKFRTAPLGPAVHARMTEENHVVEPPKK